LRFAPLSPGCGGTCGAKMRAPALAGQRTMTTRPTMLTGDDANDASALPRQIGKYRVLKRLGEGATAEVFLCHDDFKGRDSGDQAGAPAHWQ